MDSSTIRDGEETFENEGIETGVRVLSGENVLELRGRSYYYDGDERLILVDYSVVDEEQVPEEDRADRTEDDDRGGFDRYLKSWEVYHRVESLMEDPLLGGEKRGWNTVEHSEPAETFLPVDEHGEVHRQAGNLLVPECVLYLHYNFREGVFEDGGLWDEIMEGEK